MQAIGNRPSDVRPDLTAAANTFSQPFYAARMLPECKISVVVPVRDEARNLKKTLDSLVRQVDFKNRAIDPRTFEIVVLANNCVDETAAVARRFQKHTGFSPLIHVVEIKFSPPDANVGHARRTAMEVAFARFAAKADSGLGIIATTDGDTRVAPDWITAILHEINQGAEAVSGRILLDKSELARLDRVTRQYHLRDVGYRLLAAELENFLDPLAHDQAPRHFQHFNASFAVTTKAYRRAGGVPRVEFLEDFAFYQALLAVDARFRHSPLVRVYTSARSVGRTACGLSTQLRQWAAMSENCLPWTVPGLGELETRFAARRSLRRCWQRARANNYQPSDKIVGLAVRLGVPGGWLRRTIFEAETFGRLLGRVENEQQMYGAWQANFPPVDIRRAITDLRLRLSELRK